MPEEQSPVSLRDSLFRVRDAMRNSLWYHELSARAGQGYCCPDCVREATTFDGIDHPRDCAIGAAVKAYRSMRELIWMASVLEAPGRWRPIRRTSTSGKMLFVCLGCGRVSPTADKGCRTAEDPEETWECSRYNAAARGELEVLVKQARHCAGRDRTQRDSLVLMASQAANLLPQLADAIDMLCAGPASMRAGGQEVPDDAD